MPDNLCSHCGTLYVAIEHRPASRMIMFARCYHCKVPQSPSQPLKRCGGCLLVSYCSKDCQVDHWCSHKYVCKEFPVVGGENALYTLDPWEEHIAKLIERAARLPVRNELITPIFLDPRVCNTCRESRPECLTDCKCACVTYCSTWCADVDLEHKDDCNYYNCMAICKTMEYINQSYPMSLLYALRSVPGQSLGRSQGHCDELFSESNASLEVHIVTSSPILGSKIWEECTMHLFPKLMQLKLIFIIRDKAFIINNTPWAPQPRCDNCEAKNRVITCSVQKMQYHMFFSSGEYTKPDVVIIYGNTKEMSSSEEDDIHSQISYRNMTHGRHTVLVLMDATEDLVQEGVKAVDAARPIDQLVPPKMNGYKGFGSNQAQLDSVVNERNYFACLRRKH